MKLNEFFGKMDLDQDLEPKEPHELAREEEDQLMNDVFFFIIDNDDLHKKYFMDVAKAIKASKKDDGELNEDDWAKWIPMVNKGCVEFYKKHNVKGDPVEIFHKELRKDLAKKLVDHYKKDIIKGEYQLGQ